MMTVPGGLQRDVLTIAGRKHVGVTTYDAGTQTRDKRPFSPCARRTVHPTCSSC